MKRLKRILFMNALMLFTCHFCFGQNADSIRLKAIPFPLRWHNTPVSYMAEDHSLTIVAGAKTDMFRDPNVTYNTDNAPKLLFQPETDFVLSASIQHAFTSKWDGGAIVLMEDSLHWIKFCFEKDYTGAKRVVSVVTNDISDDCNAVEIKTPKVYYKLAKADNVITLYYSVNNKNWFLIRHLQFNSTRPLQVGFLAQSPTGRSCRVRFDDIRYQSKKIKDPYAGE